MILVTEDLLSSIGIDVLETKGDELVALCPGHEATTGRADNSPSWSINAETGAHFCFSCGYKGGLASLVADMLTITTAEARDWLAAEHEVDFTMLSERLERVKEAYTNPFRLVKMSEARLAVYTDPPQWALDARGLTVEACRAHTVRWEDAHHSWIIPIREPLSGTPRQPGDKLLGWQEKGQDSRLFKNRPAGVQKSFALFGLDVFMETDGKNMILVESPLDAVRLTSLGIEGGVSSYGAVVSDAQMMLLRGATRLCVALDNDKAGIKASAAIWEASRTLGMEPWFFNNTWSEGNKDIGDMTEDQIRVGIGEAVHCSRGRSSYQQGVSYR
jgi:DNA primase